MLYMIAWYLILSATGVGSANPVTTQQVREGRETYVSTGVLPTVPAAVNPIVSNPTIVTPTIVNPIVPEQITAAERNYPLPKRTWGKMKQR